MRDKSEPVPGTLGTFSGVFTPSILTILGIILFLRLGYVVGAGGLTQALIIILMANAISVLTSFSLSAIATNLKVKAGGDYYLISRTLGVNFGGALGLVLFLSQAVSIAFYAIGFGEAIAAIADGPAWMAQAVSASAIAALFVLAWLGSDWATRFQYVVMAVLFAAIISFFAGAAGVWRPGQVMENLGGDSGVPFWVLFAIFFPAVTGFTQGVSMSGDLKSPGRSIPRGTFLAVGISFVVYLAVAVGFAGSETNASLAGDYNAMRRVSAFAWLADAGVVAATLSSALASFLGAPRILQSLAADRLFPFLKPFAVGHGATNNPRRGVLLAAGIALVTVAVGDLNLIAPVVSMFFLISYGLLNFATFAESRSNSPSFRPRFRFFDARLSLVGALGCLGAMIALDPLAATISLALLAAVYVYLERSVTVQRWADSSRSVQFQRLRDSLVKLSTKLAHPRDWRPVILAFSDDAARRARLIRFAEWIEGDAGITTVVKILHGTGVRTRLQREEAERTLRKEIAELEVKAFPRAIAAADFETAVSVLLEAHGLGPVRPNTVTLNWYDPGVCAKEEGEEKQADRRSYGKNLRAALSHGCHVVVLHTTTEQFERLLACPPDERGIDVFYTNDDTGRLMLLLAYLMTRTRAWETATIRLVVERSDDEATRPEALRTMLEEARINAQLAIVDRIDAVTVRDACSCASLVFLPMRLREGVPVSAYEASPDELADALPPTAFCLAAQVIELDAPPESGIHQRIADAQDAAEVAAKRAGKSETDEVATQQAVAALEARLEQQRAEGAEPDAVEATEKELATAREAHATANRRAARDKAKSEGADREADAAADE